MHKAQEFILYLYMSKITTLNKFLYLNLIFLSTFLHNNASKKIPNDLQEANTRFIKKMDKKLIKTLSTKGQKPKYIVVSCSDSRVPPEIIFDAKVGDLFVVRLAGNVVSNVALDTISFAVSQLGTKNILVLGHTKCGAVHATIKHRGVNELTKTILPAVKKAKQEDEDVMDATTEHNIHKTADRILNSKQLEA
jgi:carbonic anhydrase